MPEPNPADTQPLRPAQPNAAGTQPIRTPVKPPAAPPGETRPARASATPKGPLVRPAGRPNAPRSRGPQPSSPPPPGVPTRGAATGRRLPTWAGWALLAVVLGSLFIAGGALAGYQSARQPQGAGGATPLQEQYQLAEQDISAGRYEVARQRLEYILKQDPAYPKASDRLSQVLEVLFTTSTPTSVPATITPTPTRDPRPAQDLLAQAKALALQGNWSAAIDTLSGLRKADPSFQTAQVDRLIYLALRNWGVDKILKENDLEGGTYELALAERIGPLDAEAATAREWARLYLYGSSFWEAMPEQAVYYFSQVAAAAPGLRDGSGWTASARYGAALLQYGDWLGKKGDWCAAQQQYTLALSMQAAANVQPTAAYAAEQCAGTPTATPLTETPTETPTASPTASLEASATRGPASPTATEAQATAAPATTAPAASATATTQAATSPAPSATSAATTQPPSPTPHPATETPSPEPSATPHPPSATPAAPTSGATSAATSAATQAPQDTTPNVRVTP